MTLATAECCLYAGLAKIFVFISYLTIYDISGSYGNSDAGGMYSNYGGGDYMSRGNDVCFYPVTIAGAV